LIQEHDVRIAAILLEEIIGPYENEKRRLIDRSSN